MCSQLKTIRDSIVCYAKGFDASLLSSVAAGEMVGLCSQIEASIAALKALAAARAAQSSSWKREGFRSPVDELSKKSKTSPGAAKRTLETGRRLSNQKEVAEAALGGELSPEQAAVVAEGVEADPTKAAQLLENARSSSLSELCEEVARLKAAVTDQEARRRAIDERRCLRRWSDRDGALHAHIYGHIEDGTSMWNLLDPIRRRLVVLRAELGRREPFDRLDYDALVAICEIAMGKDGELCLADLLELGLFPQLDHEMLAERDPCPRPSSANPAGAAPAEPETSPAQPERPAPATSDGGAARPEPEAKVAEPARSESEAMACEPGGSAPPRTTSDAGATRPARRSPPDEAGPPAPPPRRDVSARTLFSPLEDGSGFDHGAFTSLPPTGGASEASEHHLHGATMRPAPAPAPAPSDLPGAADGVGAAVPDDPAPPADPAAPAPLAPPATLAPVPAPASPAPPAALAPVPAPAPPAPPPRARPRRGRKLAGSPVRIMVRVDLDTLLRGVPIEGELCEIAGHGPVPVSVIEKLAANGNAVLVGVLTKSTKLLGVYHHRRRPNAHQASALEFLYPSCAAAGCGQRAGLQSDHRVDWSRTHFTVFDLLDRLCPHHHRLKTEKGWGLVEGSGKRAFVPPDDPRHPSRVRRAARASDPP